MATSAAWPATSQSRADMSASPIAIFDRDLLKRRRDRASASPETADFLLRHAADDIADRLSLVKRAFPLVVDLGAGHGVLTRRLSSAAIAAQTIVATDLSPSLLAHAPAPRLVADEEVLPFAPGSLDLVVSSLTLQLANDLPGVLVQIRRALKPDGLLLASLLGGASLVELREAFLVAETEILGGASPRVAPFADVRALGALMQRAGFALPVADSETLTVAYDSALHLMRDLRAMGWTNILADRSRKPLRRDVLSRAVEIYRQRHARPDGRVTATFELVTLTGWAPHESQQKPMRPGSAKARLADALGAKEIKAGEKPDET